MTAGESGRILFVHTSSISALFINGQIDHFAAAGFDTHYAAQWTDEPPAIGHPTWQLPFARQPSPLRDLRALAAAVALMRRVRPVVVHAGTPKAGLIATTAAWLTRRPVRIYAVHGLRYETTTGRARSVLRFLERCTARLATDVVADSDSIRRTVIDDLGVPADKVMVLGPGSSNGVDIERFAPKDDPSTARAALGIAADGLVLGFVGRLTHDKGIDDLVAIHRDLDDTVTLLLVGEFEPDDPVAADTRQRIEQHDRIIHVPWTDRPDEMYAAMDLLVFPSSREGLPNVPLEAQACGVPVVGYAATGTVDAVEDRASLAPVGDTTALRELVEERLADPTDRRRRGESARRWVTRFSQANVWQARLEFVERRVSARC